MAEEKSPAEIAFAEIDKDGSGSIDAKELKTFCTSMGLELTEKEIDDLIAEAEEGSKEKDGKISFEELKKFLNL